MGKSYRLPNSFGTVYRLSGNRRRPYAIAKTFGWDDKGKQIKKIIGYATSKKEGLEILLEYNKNPLADISYLNLTFEKAFLMWFEMLNNESDMSESNKSSYYSTFKNHCTPLYKIKILDLKTTDVQNCINLCKRGFNTKRYIKLVASQVYKYCLVQLDMPLRKNFSDGLKIGKNEKSNKHYPFSNNEIKVLWENLNISYVNSILILIYTGMRPSELLKLEISNIFIDEQYMIGGIKTSAGINRVIPIHTKIIPLIKDLMKGKNKYLMERCNVSISYRRYEEYFRNVMDQLNFNHTPHDGRHTLATELDNINANEVCIKLILGHKIDDITKGVYTHKNRNQLIETINQTYKNIC